jgi:hypothetical protein
MAAYFVNCYETRILWLRSHTLPALVLNGLTLLPTGLLPARSRIFHSPVLRLTLHCLLPTLSSLITVHPLASPSQRWQTLFQSRQSLSPQPTPRPVPSCCHFYTSIPKSPTSMTASTTRGTFQRLVESTNFCSNPTSTSAKENGVAPSLTCPLPELISAFKVSSSLVTSLAPFSILPLHLAAPPSIRWLPLSVPSTFIAITLLLYSRLLLIPTLIVRFG